MTLIGRRGHKRGAVSPLRRLLQDHYGTERLPVNDDVQQERVGSHIGTYVAYRVRSSDRRTERI